MQVEFGGSANFMPFLKSLAWIERRGTSFSCAVQNFGYLSKFFVVDK